MIFRNHYHLVYCIDDWYLSSYNNNDIDDPLNVRDLGVCVLYHYRFINHILELHLRHLVHSISNDFRNVPLRSLCPKTTFTTPSMNRIYDDDIVFCLWDLLNRDIDSISIWWIFQSAWINGLCICFRKILSIVLSTNPMLQLLRLQGVQRRLSSHNVRQIKITSLSRAVFRLPLTLLF